jgi:2-polyprenyl-3-methyl-5-hydroxy-6-metoxy-1,4-benzoquinol methylase
VIPAALSLYAAAPLGVRAHVFGRWATCPFDRVAARVPAQGRILEVGCGYGVLSLHLATIAPGRDVLGIDVDVRKIVHGQFVAERARGRGARCEFQLYPPGEVPDGPWDAIVICDVLYLLDADAQAGLLATCTEQLALGGSLVVKEMAPSPSWKAQWNRIQETLAVRVLHITAGEQLTFLDPDVLGAWMERDGLVVSHEPLHRGYLHPHHLIVGARRRAIDGAG